MGLKTDKAIYIGGDGRVTAGHQKFTDGGVKVFEKDGIVYGSSGDVRAHQVIEWGMKTPRYHPDDDPMQYMVTNLSSAMRKSLKDHDVLDEGGRMGVWLLVAFQGRLFQLFSNGAVLEPVMGEAAFGSGEEFALGSLESTRHSDLAPEQRVLHAIIAAERHSIGVGDSITLAIVPINRSDDDDEGITFTTVGDYEEIRPGDKPEGDGGDGDGGQ